MTENNRKLERPVDCYQIGASDVRADGNLDQQKNSRHPARATANEAALKRDHRPGEACSRHGGKSTGRTIFGGQWQAQGLESRSHRSGFLALAGGPANHAGVYRLRGVPLHESALASLRASL